MKNASRRYANQIGILLSAALSTSHPTVTPCLYLFSATYRLPNKTHLGEVVCAHPHRSVFVARATGYTTSFLYIYHSLLFSKNAMLSLSTLSRSKSASSAISRLATPMVLSACSFLVCDLCTRDDPLGRGLCCCCDRRCFLLG